MLVTRERVLVDAALTESAEVLNVRFDGARVWSTGAAAH